MEKIFSALDMIREKCGMYIGSKNLKNLANFISGYEFAVYQLTGVHIGFGGRFMIFVTYREETEYCPYYWDGILLKNYSEDEAFDKFFEYVDEFKEWIKDPKNIEEAEAELLRRSIRAFSSDGKSAIVILPMKNTEDNE